MNMLWRNSEVVVDAVMSNKILLHLFINIYLKPRLVFTCIEVLGYFLNDLRLASLSGSS